MWDGSPTMLDLFETGLGCGKDGFTGLGRIDVVLVGGGRPDFASCPGG